jgi:membrane protein
MRTPDILGIVMEAAGNWSRHKAAQAGAALAYYSVFSLGPIIVVAMALAGLLFGGDAVRGEVSASFRDLLGPSGAAAVDTMLAGASREHEGVVAIVLGTATLLFAAVGVVVQLKSVLNNVWDVDPRRTAGVLAVIMSYIISLTGVLAVGFLLIVSLLVTTAINALGHYLGATAELALHGFGTLASLLIVASLFAAMFKWLPDTEVGWRDVWLGAGLTAALFEIGKYLISLYIANQGLQSAFGAAASLVVILIWIYYTSQILLLGAEFTHVFAERHGSRQDRKPALQTSDKP